MKNDLIKGILLDAVKAASGESRLIDDLELTALCAGQVPDDIQLSNASVRETLDILNRDDASSVCVLTGKERLRCYDSSVMSSSYGEALNFAAEGNSLSMISETVRKESRLYPRPCLTDIFLAAPYNLDAGILKETIGILELDSSEFSDICRTAASNGDVYLYSDLYLNKARAEYLAEWNSVTSLECQ